MELSGKYTFKADQQSVWNLLMDPDAIAQAMPGIEAMIPIDGETNAWHAKVKLSLASVSGAYAGTIRMTEIVAPNEYRLTVHGEGKQSIIGGTALLKLSYDAESQTTLLAWTAETKISGKLASIGQRLIGAAAAMLSGLFFRSLARKLPNYIEEEEGGSTEPTV